MTEHASSHSHHDHFVVISTSRKRKIKAEMRHPAHLEVPLKPREAACYIMSIRDPLIRLMSGFLYEQQQEKRLLSFGDFWELAEAAYDTNAMNHTLALDYLTGSSFGFAYSMYLRGSSCRDGSMEVHFVCTEDMTNELNHLHALFTHSEENKDRHDAARASAIKVKEHAGIPPHLVKWIENELHHESTVLHTLICGGRGHYSPPK
jgi:hypothetical protein